MMERPTWEQWWADGRPSAMTTAAYLDAMSEWVASEAHSGPEPSEKLAEYTALNAVRMKRVAKTYRMGEGMAEFLDSGACRGQHWVVITESWCGDAAQSGPLVARLAERAGVPLEWVLRDGENAVIDDFLTRGGKSIPIWVVANGAGEVLATWGPRPASVRDMVDAYRAQPDPKPPYAEYAAQVQLWYARNRGKEFEDEAYQMLRSIL